MSLSCSFDGQTSLTLAQTEKKKKQRGPPVFGKGFPFTTRFFRYPFSSYRSIIGVSVPNMNHRKQDTKTQRGKTKHHTKSQQTSKTLRQPLEKTNNSLDIQQYSAMTFPKPNQTNQTNSNSSTFLSFAGRLLRVKPSLLRLPA